MYMSSFRTTQPSTKESQQTLFTTQQAPLPLQCSHRLVKAQIRPCHACTRRSVKNNLQRNTFLGNKKTRNSSSSLCTLYSQGKLNRRKSACISFTCLVLADTWLYRWNSKKCVGGWGMMQVSVKFKLSKSVADPTSTMSMWVITKSDHKVSHGYEMECIGVCSRSATGPHQLDKESSRLFSFHYTDISDHYTEEWKDNVRTDSLFYEQLLSERFGATNFLVPPADSRITPRLAVCLHALIFPIWACDHKWVTVYQFQRVCFRRLFVQPDASAHRGQKYTKVSWIDNIGTLLYVLCAWPRLLFTFCTGQQRLEYCYRHFENW